MTSREIVRRCLEFRDPPRIGLHFNRTITRTDAATIEAEAHELVWKLGNFGGGFMVKAYAQPNAIGMTVEQSEAQYQAFLKYSEYPLKPYRGRGD